MTILLCITIQFFIVIDPRPFEPIVNAGKAVGDPSPLTIDHSEELFDTLINLLKQDKYVKHLSTAVQQNDPNPRGITVVITGNLNNAKKMHDMYLNRGDASFNQVCIVEQYDYDHNDSDKENSGNEEIKNLSENDLSGSIPFKWKIFKYGDFQWRGQVNKLHTAGFNLRVWDTDSDDFLGDSIDEKMRNCLSECIDSVNCGEFIRKFKDISVSQDPRGRFPSLFFYSGPVTQNLVDGRSISLNSKSMPGIITWRGESESDKNLYVAFSLIDPTIEPLLSFQHGRQINLRWFLNDTPRATAPSCSIVNVDGKGSNLKFIIVYEGTDDNHMLYTVLDYFIQSPRWYIGHCPEGSTPLTSSISDQLFPVFVPFPAQRNLTLPNNALLGSTPSVAATSDGRVVIVYVGTDNQHIHNTLLYVSGRLDPNSGELVGDVHELSIAHASIGTAPSIAILPDNHVIVIYQGTGDHHNLLYVSGTLTDDPGNKNIIIDGQEFELTEGQARRGTTPSIAYDTDGHIVAVYEGTEGDHRLFYVYGTLDVDGKIIGTVVRITEDQDKSRKGTHPTATFDPDGNLIVLYEGSGDSGLFFYSKVQKDTITNVHPNIEENTFDIGMPRWSSKRNGLGQLCEVWVNFKYTGSQDGDFDHPFNKLATALAAVADGGSIKIMPGITSERQTIHNSKRIRLSAPKRAVTIGERGL